MQGPGDEPTKKQQIATLLEQNFPDRRVPRGGFVSIAEAANASRPLVSVVAQELGFEPATPHQRRRRPEGCKHCGRTVEPGKRVCRDCQEVPVACDTCGKLFKRRRDRIFERERDARYNGGMYCSRRCFYERRQRITWRPPPYARPQSH